MLVIKLFRPAALNMRHILNESSRVDNLVLIVPNFKEKWVLFQAWASTSKFKEKGCFGGQKIRYFHKAGSLALGTDG